MGEQKIRRREKVLRKNLAWWQLGTIGLMALSVLVNMVMYAVILRKAEQARYWKTECMAALQAETEAVTAYSKLQARVRQDEADQAAQQAAYDALGYEYIGECIVTYYCCEAYEHICGTGDGLTATGIPVAPGIVAVDPGVIPLGSTVIIDGVEYLAADVGGAVDGLHIDIAVPTHQEAEQLGIGSAEVWIIPPEGRA